MIQVSNLKGKQLLLKQGKAKMGLAMDLESQRKKFVSNLKGKWLLLQ